MTLVTGLVINFCVCDHPPKPVYDVAEFKRHLTDRIGQIIDTDPDAVFVLTGDLNRLDTTDLYNLN